MSKAERKAPVRSAFGASGDMGLEQAQARHREKVLDLRPGNGADAGSWAPSESWDCELLSFMRRNKLLKLQEGSYCGTASQQWLLSFSNAYIK